MPPGGTHQHPKPLVAVSRPVGQNDVGMVAWTLTMKTPECPQGRKVRADSPIAEANQTKNAPVIDVLCSLAVYNKSWYSRSPAFWPWVM